MRKKNKTVPTHDLDGRAIRRTAKMPIFAEEEPVPILTRIESAKSLPTFFAEEPMPILPRVRSAISMPSFAEESVPVMNNNNVGRRVLLRHANQREKLLLEQQKIKPIKDFIARTFPNFNKDFESNVTYNRLDDELKYGAGKYTNYIRDLSGCKQVDVSQNSQFSSFKK